MRAHLLTLMAVIGTLVWGFSYRVAWQATWPPAILSPVQLAG
jgi:hypothetical protein